MNYHSVKESTRKNIPFHISINKPLPSIKRIANYEYNEADYIGKGSFAKVYKGINKHTNEIVAIKVIELKKLREQKLTQLLVQEVKIIKSVDHPHIVKCYEVVTSENNCYIITELCDGGDLLQLLKKKKALPLNKETWGIIYEIYKALKYLNERRIVHRDIKSANILFHKGKAKLADFGFAKQIYSTLFKDIFVGSPYYMSPQGHLKQVYGPKTDVWSFGIVLFQLFHGQTPFHNCPGKKQILQQVVRPLSFLKKMNKNIPQDLVNLITLCLTVEQQRRISISQIQNTPFFRRIINQLKLQPIFKTPNLNVFPNLIVSSPIQMSKTSQGFGFNFSCNSRVVKLDNKQENINTQNINIQNINTQNLTINFRQSSEATQSSSNRPSLKSQSRPKVKTRNYLTPNTVSKSLTPPPSQHSEIRHSLKQQHTFKVANQILGYSVKSLKQCLYILHYCRLCFKTFSLIQGGNKQNLVILSSWTLKLLDEIKSLIQRNQIDFSSSTNPQQRQTKLKQVVIQYIQKYSQDLLNTDLIININHMIVTTENIWKQIDQNSGDLIAKHYSLYLAQSTWVLREALQRKDMAFFLLNSNLQGFLNHRIESLNAQTYASLRKNLSF